MNGRLMLSAFAALALCAQAQASSGLQLPTGPLNSGMRLMQVQAGNVGDDSPFKIANVAAHSATAQATEVGSYKLADVLDAQLDTNLTFTLKGKEVRISGTFDRQSNAYLSLKVKGGASAKFYDLASLVDTPGTYAIGGADYTVLLAGNPVKPLRSQIMLENDADEDDFHSTSVGKLLGAIEEAGKVVTFTDQTYRLYYFRDVKKTAKGVEVDGTSKTFALIYKEGKEMHTFLIPAETVRTDKIIIYKAYNNKKIGLRIVGDSIKIYENP
jgi:hypothetical protein